MQRFGSTHGQGRYSIEADMWSIGVILYVLISGTHPFSTESSPLYDKIQAADYSLEGEVWTGVSIEAKELIRQLLVIEPSGRITAADALNHPWFKNINNGGNCSSTGSDKSNKNVSNISKCFFKVTSSSSSSRRSRDYPTIPSPLDIEVSNGFVEENVFSMAVTENDSVDASSIQLPRTSQGCEPSDRESRPRAHSENGSHTRDMIYLASSGSDKDNIANSITTSKSISSRCKDSGNDSDDHDINEQRCNEDSSNDYDNGYFNDSGSDHAISTNIHNYYSNSNHYDNMSTTRNGNHCSNDNALDPVRGNGKTTLENSRDSILKELIDDQTMLSDATAVITTGFSSDITNFHLIYYNIYNMTCRYNMTYV